MAILHISEDLHQELKLKAISNNKKLGEFSNEIISKALEIDLVSRDILQLPMKDALTTNYQQEIKKS